MPAPPGAALSHIIYASTAADAVGEAELAALLARARDRNASLHVTGMLLYSEGSFLQVIEGADDAVARLYARIEADPRHRDVTCIIDEPIAQRAFGDWSMGYCAVSPSELQELDSVGGAAITAQSFLGMPAGRARRLLAAFADGRWRAHG